ncbi:DNA translocase FtsK [Quadrisphaera oryzae]|uniref:helix-turn-helix domain-containing protein n=1 Tax=Quadrisphaera TaxID=317661 RepID=UPI0021050815|nr:DNA translocase FtsK [Quadrisphaera sp. RL12-1S]
MARPRSFEEGVVVDAAARCFTDLGYAATSVDDLVGATGLHRGSLYGAFGSKRGLFLAALARHASAPRERTDDDDEQLRAAAERVIATQFGSTSMLQRVLGVGFAEAEGLMDALERRGVVGPAQQASPRAVLVPEHQLDDALERFPGGGSSTGALDLLLVAALELAPHDDEVRDLVREACGALGPAAATVLGRRLLERARLEDGLPDADAAAPVPAGPTPAPPATRRT